MATDEDLEDSDYKREIARRIKAEEVFRSIDCNERIRKQIAQKTYAYEKTFYKRGDDVLYKNTNQTKWIGPVKILSVDGMKIQIIENGHEKSIHKSKIRHAKDNIYIVKDDIHYVLL